MINLDSRMHKDCSSRESCLAGTCELSLSEPRVMPMIVTRTIILDGYRCLPISIHLNHTSMRVIYSCLERRPTIRKKDTWTLTIL